MKVSWSLSALMVIFLYSLNNFAAINKKDMDMGAILDLPVDQIETYAKNASPDFLFKLKQWAFDEDRALSERWKSLVLAAKIGGPSMLNDLKEASRNSQWYMRSAALSAASQISQSEALQMARRLIDDKALVVRSAAVDVLGGSDENKDREILWKCIHDAKNKRKGQSLWIRPQALNWLVIHPVRKDIPALIKILKEENTEMGEIAITGLEKVSEFKFGVEHESLDDKKQRWLNWWELNGRTRTL